ALTRRGAGVADGMLLLDVGGGSTELSTGSFQVSLDVGTVRLTERHLRDDPPTAEQLAAATAELEAQLPELDAQDAVGVAGTVHQLADLTGRDHVTAAEAELWLDTLAVLPLE